MQEHSEGMSELCGTNHGVTFLYSEAASLGYRDGSSQLELLSETVPQTKQNQGLWDVAQRESTFLMCVCVCVGVTLSMAKRKERERRRKEKTGEEARGEERWGGKGRERTGGWEN